MEKLQVAPTHLKCLLEIHCFPDGPQNQSTADELQDHGLAIGSWE